VRVVRMRADDAWNPQVDENIEIQSIRRSF
jgi:hypothetical protein